MIIEYFLNMSNSELIYFLIIIILILMLILFGVKFKKRTKNHVTNNDDVPKVTQIVKPITVPAGTPNQSEDKNQLELDRVLEQMRNSLNEQEKDDVQLFEDEQEEKSIISYQELLRANNKEISVEKKEEQPQKLEKVQATTEKNTKFRNSEFISPIYGRVDNDLEYPTIPKIRRAKLGDDEIVNKKVETPEPELEIIDDIEIDIKEEKPISINEQEKTIDSKNLKKEMNKNEQFLKALKDFRESLE